MRKKYTFILTVYAEDGLLEDLQGRLQVVTTGRRMNFTKLAQLSDLIGQSLQQSDPASEQTGQSISEPALLYPEDPNFSM